MVNALTRRVGPTGALEWVAAPYARISKGVPDVRPECRVESCAPAQPLRDEFGYRVVELPTSESVK